MRSKAKDERGPAPASRRQRRGSTSEKLKDVIEAACAAVCISAAYFGSIALLMWPIAEAARGG